MKFRILLPLLAVVLFLLLVPAFDNQLTQEATTPIGKTAGAAVFSVSDLVIRPDDSSPLCDINNVGTDEGLVVSVTVTNLGDRVGSHDLVLYVNRVEVEKKSVTLAAGESVGVEFNLFWGMRQEGVYTVNIEGLQGTFGIG